MSLKKKAYYYNEKADGVLHGFLPDVTSNIVIKLCKEHYSHLRRNSVKLNIVLLQAES